MSQTGCRTSIQTPPSQGQPSLVELRRARANGIELAYLEGGTGPTVVLLHGYPDNAWSWEHQFPALIGAGYRVIAPFMRGYPPSTVDPQAYFDRATLALDVQALIDFVSEGQPVHLVGQDWGAAVGYGVLAACPESIRKAVMLAVPHPAQVRRTLRRSPRHLVRSFHWFLFQLPWLPELLLDWRQHAFVEFLWWLWSPNYRDSQHVARVRQSFSEPGVIEATLGYYRAMFREARQDPSLMDLRSRLEQAIQVPTLVVCGSRDMRREMLPLQAEFFSGEYQWKTVSGCGHFLHREKPEEVNRLILGWLASHTA